MSGDADRTVVIRGAMRTIEYAVCSNASMPAREFIEDELSQAEQATLLALFKRMADHGSVPNREQFKVVRGKLFEFKKHQIRVFCFRKDDRWLLTNGYRKKKDRLDRGEVERAERIMDAHLQREARKKEERTK